MLSDLGTKTKRNIRKHLEFEGIYYLDYGDANTHMLLCLATLLCPVFHDPMDCSPPGPSVRGISQAGILEWVAIPFSRDPC